MMREHAQRMRPCLRRPPMPCDCGPGPKSILNISQLTAATRSRTDDVAREVSQTLHDWTADELRALRKCAQDVVALVDRLLPQNENTTTTIRSAELDMSVVTLGGERLLP